MANQNSTGTDPRAQRGLALFRSGAVSQHGDLYIVRGTSRNYTVILQDDGPRCDCPDFRRRRQTCKHGYAVELAAAKDRCKRRKRVDRRHKSEGEGLRGITADMNRLDEVAGRLGV